MPDDGYFILFGIGLGLIAFLIWMLFPIADRRRRSKSKEKPRGFCPICKHPLMKGERIRSDQTEIGDVELQTWIKGCPFCLAVGSRQKRVCPVCKKKLEKGKVILAVSNPRQDKHKLAIKGCERCFPQGFMNKHD